jgi:hypothetical protein
MLQGPEDGAVENLVRDFWIHCRKGVVKQVDVRVLVDSSGETNSGFLAPTDIHSAFPNNRALSVRENLHVRFEATGSNTLSKPRLVINKAEYDVFLDCAREDERFLLNISDFAFDV